MNMTFFPKLQTVDALNPYLIRTVWKPDEILEVDVGTILKRIKCLAPILKEENFKKVHVCDNGQCVEWFDTEFGADNVYAWAIEQRGQPSHEMFHVWLYRNKMSNTEAARILGISRRMVEWYATARKKIPWNIWLACVGYETLTKSVDPIDKESVVFNAKMVEASIKICNTR